MFNIIVGIIGAFVHPIDTPSRKMSAHKPRTSCSW